MENVKVTALQIMKDWYINTFDMNNIKGVSQTPATSNMEFFVTLFNGWKPLTNVTKSFILYVAGILDTFLIFAIKVRAKQKKT